MKGKVMRRQEGQTFVVYALFLAGLMGMSALAVDLGYLYTGRAALQAAVDAGALGGASGLPDTSIAQARAIDFGSRNVVFSQSVDLNPATSSSTIEFGNYTMGTFTVSATGVNALRITGQMSLPLFFAPVVGINTATLTAQAVGVMIPTVVSCGAIFADDLLEINGVAVTNSYNSNNGPYGGANVAGRGNICSNGPINLVGTTMVDGDATPGVGETVSFTGGPVVTGWTNPLSSPVVMPQIDPAALAAAAVTNDNGALGPDLMLAGNTILTLNSGTYYFDDLRLVGSSTLQINPTSGPVTIYVTGNLDIGGTGIVNLSGIPANLRIYKTSSSTAKWHGTSAFHGVILAPNAELQLSGTADYYGAAIADQIDIDGVPGVHYDEGLMDIDFSPQVQMAFSSAFLGG